MNRAVTILRRRHRDYRAVFQTEPGQRVLRDLHRFCVLAAPSADPNEALFTMGMQRVFRRIVALSGTSDDVLVNFALSQQEDENDD